MTKLEAARKYEAQRKAAAAKLAAALERYSIAITAFKTGQMPMTKFSRAIDDSKIAEKAYKQELAALAATFAELDAAANAAA